MGAEEVTEFAARSQDGHWQVRVTRPGEPYPAGQWARDQQAIGARVLRRRVIVVDDWTEMRLHETA
jgi:hypothetical protein